jgi:sugar transferase (PEP-CTERM/EpsH1 system associated)
LKILLTLPRPLFPADTGGKIRTLNIFRRLAERVEIHAVSLAHPQRDAEAIAEMRRTFHSYTAVQWQETRKFTPGFYAEFLRSRFGRLPYFLAKYALPEFRRAVEELAARERVDLVLCDFLQSAVALQGSALRPRVIFEHNVEYMIRKRHWETEEHPLRKWLLAAEWKKAREAEAAICREFDHVITVSEEDERQIREEFGATRVSALPTGVDVEYFTPQDAPQRAGNLVFVGSMDWQPNEDGIFWFVREVYPKIREGAPHSSLTVVGRNPSERIRKLADQNDSIEITGTVPDVRPYLARAEAVVVPLRIGGGTRIKIFEAMAMERAVVSTTLGAEGLPVQKGQEILLGDSPATFADAVVQLLAQPEAREALVRAGRARVIRDHTWESVARRMEEILLRVTRPGARAPEETVAVSRAMLAN